MWQALREELHPKGVEIVTIALDVRGADAARPYIEAAQPAHPALIDSAHVCDDLLGIVNVPSSVWIDEQGMIVRPAEPAWPGRTPVLDMLPELTAHVPPEPAGERPFETALWRVAKTQPTRVTETPVRGQGRRCHGAAVP